MFELALLYNTREDSWDRKDSKALMGKVMEYSKLPAVGRISKIELAKRLKGLKDVVSKGDYESIRDLLVTPEQSEAIEKAIQGLSEEDEFSLLCRLMGTATHLVRFEQNPIIRGEYIAPDFLARFQPGCTVCGSERKDSTGFKCLIEVKSTTKDQFKIKGSDLRRRRNFADTFGLPLLFAVRFVQYGHSAVWVIVEDSDHTRSSLTFSIPDMIRGVRHVIWDEYFLMLKPNVYFRSLNDPSFEECGSSHLKFGNLGEFHVVDGSRTAVFSGTDALVVSSFFRGYHLEEVGTQKEGTTTTRTFRPTLRSASLADLVYKINRIATDEEGQAIFNASKALAMADQEHGDTLIERMVVESVASVFLGEDILFMIAFEDPKDHLEKWRAYGGHVNCSRNH